eukprot:CAMPEP_0202361866 /NCGR_PEP_ID=MMETSP1126-20121109/14260_1 /ASSEMBLY_ACC=CAM_ASM_000457 /TAXON_ID=3047 /ORGANISM="Dunaliella tertiolecta, Strain CCMP1320" /LENGTH=80 /DNA_ID=CAMNT_0048955909 /DNA_START=609 /DNA_END=848 /DNA_ORIENTATION=-
MALWLCVMRQGGQGIGHQSSHRLQLMGAPVPVHEHLAHRCCCQCGGMRAHAWRHCGMGGQAVAGLQEVLVPLLEAIQLEH